MKLSSSGIDYFDRHFVFGDFVFGNPKSGRRTFADGLLECVGSETDLLLEQVEEILHISNPTTF
jgi:hypothetical protein